MCAAAGVCAACAHAGPAVQVPAWLGSALTIAAMFLAVSALRSASSCLRASRSCWAVDRCSSAALTIRRRMMTEALTPSNVIGFDGEVCSDGENSRYERLGS